MKKIAFFTLFTFVYSLNFAQLLPCGEHLILQEKLKDPEFKAQFELDQKIQKQVLHEMLKNPVQKRGTIYKIPIVFHVLHSNGEENISREQILDQLAILNRDYRLQNADALNVHPDFKGKPADVQVEFVLATIAPNKKCFSGITRTFTPTLETVGANQIQLIVDGNDVYQGEWPGDQYLNIFICQAFNIQASGYTLLPNSNYNGMNNGIFVLHNYVGSIGTSTTHTSRVLTHESGHWLNLYHTWGPGNSAGDTTNCQIDDDVLDTPNCIGDKEVCNLNDKYCGQRANVENYMDYSYCSKMFTQGQVDRMHAALNSYIGGRKNIWSTLNLTTVGGINPVICKADFTTDYQQTCLGEQIIFKDASYNSPKKWLWTFPGGTPATSTDQNPTVIYNTPGSYNVTLTVSDGTNSLTITKTNFITVLGEGKKIPLLETFTNYSSISNSTFWSVFNSGNNQAFEVFNGAGYSDTKCLKLSNFVESIVSTDEIISSAIDLSNIKDQGQVTLTFRYAYRKKNTTNSEVLRVYMSGDCGANWNSRKTLSGVNLSGAIVTTNWTPTSPSDWTTVHITNINSTYWTPNTRLRFSFDGSGGNNFFLDDINLYPAAPSSELIVGINEQELQEDIRVYPIPTYNELHLEFTLQSNITVSYNVLDVSGKKVIGSTLQGALGKNLVIIPTNELLAGSYILQLNVGGGTLMKYFQVTK